MAEPASAAVRSRVIPEAVENLPTDPEELRDLLLAERAAHTAALAGVQDQNERLRQIIRELQRARFGRHSEKLSPDQLNLGLEDIEQAIATGEAQEEGRDSELRSARAAKRKLNRGALPTHLPRVEVVIDVEDKTCPCCGGGMHVIGEDRSERLDVVPAHFRVIVTRRPKYGCRACEGAVVQVAATSRLIEGGLPTEGLVAHVLVAKYADHCPLYRQAQIYARQGITLDRSTLAHWVGRAAWLLAPIHARLLEKLKSSPKLFADETTAPVLDPGRGRTKKGQLWAVARDDRPWAGPDPPAVVYTYAPGRGAQHATAILKGFTGILQVDGYAGYRDLANPARGGRVTLAFCWAHFRRLFYEIASGGAAPIATEALERIAALYRIEDNIRGRGADERRAARQARARPLIAELQSWLAKQLGVVSTKSKIADAIRYGLKHWDGLIRFLDDGRIEIDSNTVERSMRPIALNRKNALFAGSDEGGVHWGVIASLIETCKLNDVDPQFYLADVLIKLVNDWPMRSIDELMPWVYSKLAQAAVA
jgi:transposase